MKAEQLVVEAKITREGRSARDIGDELIVDIGRYRSHPDCKTLVCFVYDPSLQIGNPDALECDLSGTTDGLDVRVIVTPKH